jgi:hypothetical protein
MSAKEKTASNIVSIKPKKPILPSGELTAAQVVPVDAQWTWYPRIGEGGINLMGAPGGTGKGLLCADLAARITKGDVWPFDDDEGAPMGNVLWCETEDSFKAAVVPRLIAAGADRRRVILKKPAEFFELSLRRYIQKMDIRLLVMSPLNSFLEGLKDSTNGINVRNVMEELIEQVEDTQCP